jgi:hypothetical protein
MSLFDCTHFLPKYSDYHLQVLSSRHFRWLYYDVACHVLGSVSFLSFVFLLYEFYVVSFANSATKIIPYFLFIMCSLGFTIVFIVLFLIIVIC